MNTFEKEALLIEASMLNAYIIITGEKSLEGLLDEDLSVVALPWDPQEEKSIEDSIKDVDILIDYFSDQEEYEKCSKLVKVKEKLLNV